MFILPEFLLQGERERQENAKQLKDRLAQSTQHSSKRETKSQNKVKGEDQHLGLTSDLTHMHTCAHVHRQTHTHTHNNSF